jgi:hypothetical protein
MELILLRKPRSKSVPFGNIWQLLRLRQKSYVDKRRKPIEFEVGYHVYLKMSPMKGVQRFGVKRKLAPQYVGMY